eukprot:14426366-Alexandrium_andersonii.AAC.1
MFTHFSAGGAIAKHVNDNIVCGAYLVFQQPPPGAAVGSSRARPVQGAPSLAQRAAQPVRLGSL